MLKYGKLLTELSHTTAVDSSLSPLCRVHIGKSLSHVLRDIEHSVETK